MTTGIDTREIIRAFRTTQPGGLLTDIDGTISRIAHHPDAATVDEAAREALTSLGRKLELVAAVSGRSAIDARNIVRVDSLVYSGNHGMEIWRDGRLEQSDDASVYIPRIAGLIETLEREITIEGIYFENKELTASIHVRECPNPEEAERQILERADSLARDADLRITRGRMVIEIRPPIQLNKGTSVMRLVDEYRLRCAVYIGDDVTDVDAFRALSELREATGQPYLSIGVTGPETPDAVAEHADALVQGVDGVVEFLEALDSALSESR